MTLTRLSVNVSAWLRVEGIDGCLLLLKIILPALTWCIFNILHLTQWSNKHLFRRMDYEYERGEFFNWVPCAIAGSGRGLSWYVSREEENMEHVRRCSPIDGSSVITHFLITVWLLYFQLNSSICHDPFVFFQTGVTVPNVLKSCLY